MLDPVWSRPWGDVRDLAMGRPTMVLLLSQLTEIAAAVLALAIVHPIDPNRHPHYDDEATRPLLGWRFRPGA